MPVIMLEIHKFVEAICFNYGLLGSVGLFEADYLAGLHVQTCLARLAL